MNMNDLAKKVAANEGLKKNLTIAQVKEVMKFIAIIIAEDEDTQKSFLAYGKKAAVEIGKPKKKGKS